MKAQAIVVTFFCTLTASAQVQIRVPSQHYEAQDRINVEIVNTGTGDVSFCVEYGYVSYAEDHSESTPTPVYVQQKKEKGWDTLLTGPDVGSIRQSVTLGRGESQVYPFRVNAHGKIRVVLDYWVGNGAGSCESPKGRREVKSRAFQIE
ncbi:MAG: hypothetical protein WBP85_14985 [Terracidiphilus sp.]